MKHEALTGLHKTCRLKMHPHSGFLVFAIACSALLCSSVGTVLAPDGYVSEAKQQQRLAVVVPAYQGDLKRAVASLEQWPTICSPITQENVDLVLYYAEGEEDASDVDAAATAIVNSAGHCFRETLTVYAHLSEEDDVYPKGPSVMFYKMFLDTDVRSELSAYDALAIIEWDVLVASERSFEELYYATFRVNEEFWVKGSNLEGTNFHSSSTMSDMWHVLGHINGNAIYNNNDPAFVEYVRYTLSRWEYSYPYDVALWLTISDFPYSWPLYQRFSNKFVTTNLIAYVGKEHVDHGTVSDAVAGQTLFIHGKNVDEGSRLSAKTADEGSADTDVTSAPEVARKLRQLNANREWNESHESNQLALESGETWRSLQADPYSRRLAKSDDADSSRIVRKMRNGKSQDQVQERHLQADPYARRLAEEDSRNASNAARKLQRWKNEEIHQDRQLQTDPYARRLADSGRKGASKVARKLQKWKNDEGHYDERNLQTDPYARRLANNGTKNASKIARKLQKWKNEEMHGERHLQADPYARRLADNGTKSASKIARKLQKWKNEEMHGERHLQADPYARRLADDGTKSASKIARKLQKWKNAELHGERHLQADPYARRLADNGAKSASKVARKLQKWKDGGVHEERHLQADPYARRLENKSAKSASEVARKLQKWKNSEIQDERHLQADPYARRLADNGAKSASKAARQLQKWKNAEMHDERHLQADPYARRLADNGTTGASKVARKLQKWKEEEMHGERNLQTDPYARRLAESGTKSASKVARKLQKLKDDEENDKRHLQADPYARRLADVENESASKVARKLRRWRAEDQSDGRQLQADPYTRRLADHDNKRASKVARKLEERTSSRALRKSNKQSAEEDEFVDAFAGQLPEDGNVHLLAEIDEDDDCARFFKEESERLFVQDVVRGSICAFVTGTSADADRTTVTVESILRFMPGVRVAIAAEDAALDTYKRAFEGLPGVSVSSTQSTITASLYADEYCGTADTALIYYVKPGSVVSRTFTAKDTHSPQGDLLVVYGKDAHLDTDHASGEWARTVLGFEAPSFTSGTDLILPIGANADLRAAFMSGDNVETALETLDDLAMLGNASTVPQLLAALQYKQATPGIWFFNPQEWVSKHLFQTASIWEIPLVKPRFICEIYPSSTAVEGSSADVLRKHLDFFTMGGTCEGGVISAQP